MGQMWESPQSIQQSQINQLPFLILEKVTLNQDILQASLFKNNNFRSRIKQSSVQPKFQNLESLNLLNDINRIQHSDFLDIFTQLIQVLYEMHKKNLQEDQYHLDIQFLQRLLKNLFMASQDFFLWLKYLYKMINTYESDCWLVAKIMWQLYSKQDFFYNKSIQEPGENVQSYKLTQQKLYNQEFQPNKLVQFINKMLLVYPGQRITLFHLLN
ncbi:unnamed protein product [Paramecium sonneborni]|uniref:Kinase domain protein n=1 Tax=Paramecium sonneborni TaxID=65129 RepID=A0A8S1LJW8_9CILI|nr:unnamed protein product [Paramecium sonneborni]